MIGLCQLAIQLARQMNDNYTVENVSNRLVVGNAYTWKLSLYNEWMSIINISIRKDWYLGITWCNTTCLVPCLLQNQAQKKKPEKYDSFQVV